MLTAIVSLKLEILCHGVNFSDAFLNYYKSQPGSIEKRRAYGTGDSVVIDTRIRTPQEIILEGQIIAAANYNPSSAILIDIVNQRPILRYKDNVVSISFPQRPLSYGKQLSSGEMFEKYVTVYGNSTLGIFSPGHCYY